MPATEVSREEDLRRLLTDAIEVQLAALKAGISFWSEWIEQTSAFVQSATESLSSITSEDQNAKDVLLELVDAGRESIRTMTEIPRHSAAKFIEELDKAEKKKAEEEAGKTKSARRPLKPASTTKGKARPRPRRAGRAKV